MGRSFGGGGMGGGRGMLRTVHRPFRGGFGGSAQEPFSHSTSKTTANTSTTKPTNKSCTLSSPSPFSSQFSNPICATSTSPTWASCTSPTCSDEFDWECIDGSEDEMTPGFYDDFVFGAVPSKDEVQYAVSSLQRVLDPASFSQFIKDRIAYNSDSDAVERTNSPTDSHKAGSELDLIEPSLQLCNSRTLQSPGFDRVYDAFHLLQTEPTVQRMVISLSSDKAVWDAVLNNEVVRELRKSLSEADKNVSGTSDEGSWGSNAAADILSWIFMNTKAKVMELIDKLTKLVNELFQPSSVEAAKGGAQDKFEGKLRSSFLLSVVVFLIVVVSRARRA